MRKKTIEEELKEIAEEKEDHIEQLEKQFGHSKKHSYDFSPEEKSDKVERKKTSISSAETSSVKTDNAFTFDDYCKMMELEQKEQTDEEFEEYCNLCDRFAEAPNKDELEDLYNELQEKIKENNNTIAHYQKGIDELKGYIADSKARLKKINEISKDIDRKHTHSVGSFIFPIIFLCFFVAAGLGVTIFAGIIPMTKYSNFVEVTATVQEIENTYYDDGDLYARLRVSYVYNEQVYSTTIKREVTNSIQEGSTTLKIYINPNDPTDVRNNNSSSYIFPTIFGIVFAGFALLMQSVLITQAVKAKRRKK